MAWLLGRTPSCTVLLPWAKAGTGATKSSNNARTMNAGTRGRRVFMHVRQRLRAAAAGDDDARDRQGGARVPPTQTRRIAVTAGQSLARFLIQMGVPTNPKARRIWFSKKR